MDHFNFDSEYLLRLRARDAATLDHFYGYFYVPIRNKLRHRFGWQETQDIAQDVFVAALVKIDAGEPRDPGKLPGYMFGICRLVGLKAFEDLLVSRNRVDADLSEFAAKAASAEERLLRNAGAGRLQRALRKLSKRDSRAIFLEFFLGDDRATASQKMGLSRENFRLIKFRALQRLRHELDKGAEGC